MPFWFWNMNNERGYLICWNNYLHALFLFLQSIHKAAQQ